MEAMTKTELTEKVRELKEAKYTPEQIKSKLEGIKLIKAADKMTYDQRQRLTKQKLPEWRKMMENPSKRTEWATCGEPVQFVKALKNYLAYEDAKAENKPHVSQVSVDVDGTNSGTQLYSGAYRDLVTAFSVNVAPTDIVQDVYLDIAEAMLDIIDRIIKGSDTLAEFMEEDTAEKIICLKELKEAGINRKHTKRIVMCLPYGLTFKGIYDYSKTAIQEEMKGVKFTHEKFIVNCFAKVAQQALKENASCAMVGMEFFKIIARYQAMNNKPVIWTVPVTGFKGYRFTEGIKIEETRVRYPKKKEVNTKEEKETVYETGQFKTAEYKRTGKADAGKMCNAIAPDVIHSLDAGLLMSTVKSAFDKYGMTDFKLVHDSFGTHANDIDKLQECIRESFVKIVQGNFMLQFACEVVLGTKQGTATREDWELCKATVNSFFTSKNKEQYCLNDTMIQQGDFNIDEVLKSKYIFS